MEGHGMCDISTYVFSFVWIMMVGGGRWVCGLWTPKYFTDYLDYRLQDTKRLFGLFDLNCPPII